MYAGTTATGTHILRPTGTIGLVQLLHGAADLCPHILPRQQPVLLDLRECTVNSDFNETLAARDCLEQFPDLCQRSWQVMAGSAVNLALLRRFGVLVEEQMRLQFVEVVGV